MIYDHRVHVYLADCSLIFFMTHNLLKSIKHYEATAERWNKYFLLFKRLKFRFNLLQKQKQKILRKFYSLIFSIDKTSFQADPVQQNRARDGAYLFMKKPNLDQNLDQNLDLWSFFCLFALSGSGCSDFFPSCRVKSLCQVYSDEKPNRQRQHTSFIPRIQNLETFWFWFCCRKQLPTFCMSPKQLLLLRVHKHLI